MSETNNLNNEDQPSKLEYNKKMIGKKVYVLNHGGWYGVVVGVVDEGNLLVKNINSGRKFSVNIFEVRSYE